MTTSKTYELPHESQLLRILIGAAVALVLLYGYSIFASIQNAIAGHDAMQQIDSISASITSLEQEYADANSRITEENAAEYGFVRVPDAHYVTRPLPLRVAVSSTL